MDIHEDRWLSERLGRPVFSLAGLEDGVNAAAVEAHTAGRDEAMYQARVPVEREDVVSTLEAVGFAVVSTNVILERDPREGEGPPDPGGEVEVVDALPEHRDELLEIAATSFRYSRFHMDPAIPDAAANRVKRDWLDSYLRGERGEQLLVALAGGRPAGFLAVLSARDGGRLVRVIDLTGVGPAHQGAGVGRSLVERFLADSAGRCDLVRVGTQAANEPGVAFYTRFGFEPARSRHDLHLHVGGPRR